MLHSRWHSFIWPLIFFVAIFGLGMVSITSCIVIGPGPNFDPEALDIEQGEMEIVIPAEHSIEIAQVSPDGEWLYYAYTNKDGKPDIGLLDISENILYENFPLPLGSAWLDGNHLAGTSGNGLIWRLSDMTVMPRHVVHVESFEEGRELLAGATDLFFVQRSSRMAIESTNPDFPYSIRFKPSQLGCTHEEGDWPQLFTPCVEAMLTPEQTYTVSLRRTVPNDPVYSFDGQYYVERGHYPDDPTHSLGGHGDQLFATGSSDPLVFGYRYGWNAGFLGWAHDNSGAYVLFRPRSALGDLTRSQYPIRKYLVPGAEPRGLPTVISPAPTPRWLPTPAVTPPNPVPNPTEETSSTLPSTLWILPLMMVGVGLIYIQPKGRRKNMLGGTVILVGVFFSLNSCIAIGPGRNFDPEALDIQKGEMEIIIPAQHYISEAQVSPDGKWLYYGYRSSNTGEPSIALLNIVENILYEDITNAGGTIWLDGNHLASPGATGSVWRLSDMSVMPRHVVHVESFEEGRELLAGATDLFFVQRSSRMAIESTNPDFPYSIRFKPSQLGCTHEEGDWPQLFTPCVEAMLTPEQTYTVSLRRTVPNDPVYSFDGQYYVERGHYPDDPTHSLGGHGDQLFATGSSDPLVFGYRYGWNAGFLGWAHDNSGAYVLFRPRSALGDLTRSQYPIRKYLVPGAEARGLPTVISPAPTPRWLPTPDVTPPASSQGGMQWVTLPQQPTPLGWVIDDVVIEETSPPILTLWIENFPNINTLQGDTVTNNSDSQIDDWEIELPPTNGPTLHWDIQHSQDCWGFGGWSPNGQLFTLTPTGQQPISDEVITPYYLTCFNQFGHTTVQVTPDPGYLAISSGFWANNQAPLFMELQKPPITLQWGAAYSGGATCQASGAWSGIKSGSGSQQIWGLTVGKHRFTLTCPQETLSVLVVVNE